MNILHLILTNERYNHALIILILILPLISFICSGCNSETTDEIDVISFVDPFIGTDAHGHTYPGAVAPFGMVQLSPDTGTEGWDWSSGYHYSDNSIIGFSHLHLSGTGIGDLGDVLLMPYTGDVPFFKGSKDNPDSGYRSRFSHDNESAYPGYYSVYLDDYQIKVELTAGHRMGFHKYTFESNDERGLLIDLEHGIASTRPIDTYLEVVSDSLIRGYRLSSGWAGDQRVYFAIRLSSPVDLVAFYNNGEIISGKQSLQGPGVKAQFRIPVEGIMSNEQLLAKVGISAVSMDNAQENLDRETDHWDFERVRDKTTSEWRNQLGRIKANLGSDSLNTVFYTALYRTALAPVLFMDYNSEYQGTDGKVQTAKDFTNYSIFSLWDTFRALHPLYTIIEDEQRVRNMLFSLYAQYEQTGLLPVWNLLGNETNTMIGYHAIPVITDAIIKGILTHDEAEIFFEAMLASALQDDHDINLYREYGYIPSELGTEATVSKTLEYAYDDWCIAQTALFLEKNDYYEKFMERAGFYRNVYDAESGFMRGRFSDGSWRDPFDPRIAEHWGYDFVEANSWQYTWFVPHDVTGLIDLMGGEDNFVIMLDSLFEQEEWLGYDAVLDVTGLVGLYAQGNEPSHHIAYLYSYAGEPEKQSHRVRQIMLKLYNHHPNGLPGNEDKGQMSAWYVFGALGFYPVNPADGRYIFGSPLVHEAELALSNGNSLRITTENQAFDHYVIKEARLNGKKIDRFYITHDEIMAGGHLHYVMGPM